MCSTIISGELSPKRTIRVNETVMFICLLMLDREYLILFNFLFFSVISGEATCPER